jgi:hypothetical protein
VADLDEVAVAAGVIAGADDPALGGGEDGRALGRGDVDALVRARRASIASLRRPKGELIA